MSALVARLVAVDTSKKVAQFCVEVRVRNDGAQPQNHTMIPPGSWIVKHPYSDFAQLHTTVVCDCFGVLSVQLPSPLCLGVVCVLTVSSRRPSRPFQNRLRASGLHGELPAFTTLGAPRCKSTSRSSSSWGFTQRGMNTAVPMCVRVCVCAYVGACMCARAPAD